MSEFRVAERYAKSIIQLANERGELEAVHNDMLYFKKVCDECRDFRLMLTNPIITSDKKSAVLMKIFKGGFKELTIKFFELIASKGRESVLLPIAIEFHNQYKLLKGIESATLSTPFPIDEAMRDKFKSYIKKMSGLEVELKEKIDPSLIGGFVLKINDKQIDDSIKKRLNKMKLGFSENLYVPEF